MLIIITYIADKLRERAALKRGFSSGKHLPEKYPVRVYVGSFLIFIIILFQVFWGHPTRDGLFISFEEFFEIRMP